MRRRLDLIILGHIWALGPLVLIWFLVPAWRGEHAPAASPALTALALGAVAYLLVRTWLNITSRIRRLNDFWPYLDVVLVTTALILVRNPTDAFFVVYFIPLASAVASLSIAHVVALAGVTATGYLLVVVLSDVAWSVNLVYRLVIIGIMASLYGWVIRTVTVYERAAERAEYQTELAREIHDGIQHLLITLGARLELAHRLVKEAPERAAQIVAQERETARRGADELRYLVRRLRTGTPQQVDLASALRHQIATLAERWPFALEIEVSPHLPRLAPAGEHALLRVIQESLTNVAKHARATRAEVRLSLADRAVQCSIHDDGVGFDPAAHDGGGLEGLRERLRAVGGTLDVRSAPGTGTTVTASLPVNQRIR